MFCLRRWRLPGGASLISPKNSRDLVRGRGCIRNFTAHQRRVELGGSMIVPDEEIPLLDGVPPSEFGPLAGGIGFAIPLHPAAMSGQSTHQHDAVPDDSPSTHSQKLVLS